MRWNSALIRVWYLLSGWTVQWSEQLGWEGSTGVPSPTGSGPSGPEALGAMEELWAREGWDPILFNLFF